MFYVDSSVAVSAVSKEAATEAVLEWLAAEENIVTSDWLMTEAATALSQKRRMQIISADQHARASEALHQQIGGAFSSLPVSRQDFRLAARFAGRADARLRAGDALHLAIAASSDATIVTLDKAQARAGALLQVKTLLL
jgi:predicted nucleic acid-binding protein